MQTTLGWFEAEMRVQDRKSNSFYIELSPANVDQSKQCCYSANERTHMLQTFCRSGTVIEEVTWIKKSGTNRGKLERIHLYIFSYHGRVPWSTSFCWTKFGPPNLDDEHWSTVIFFQAFATIFRKQPMFIFDSLLGKELKLSKTSWKTPERSQWRSLSGF